MTAARPLDQIERGEEGVVMLVGAVLVCSPFRNQVREGARSVTANDANPRQPQLDARVAREERGSSPGQS